MPAAAAELRLVGEQERRGLDAASFAEWGGGLALGAHLERERALRDTPWSRASLSTWVWEAGEERLASCETYAVPSSVEGVVGVSWEIASVFTPEASRGKGHASRMLDALADQLGMVPNAQALVLFSDVGEAMYARLGFVGLPAWNRVFPAEAGAVEGVRLLPPEGLARHWPRWPAANEEGFTLVPSVEQLGWHLRAAELRALAERRAPLPTVGAVAGEGAIAWAEAREHDELRVLDLVTRSPAEARLLLRAAQAAAAEAGLAAVVAWESTDGAPWPETFGARMERRGAVPMIRPFMAELDVEAWRRVPRGLWV